MKLIRLLLLTIFLATISFPLLLTPAGEAQPGALTRIAPGVWFREGEQPSRGKVIEMKYSGNCNNVFIEMKDYLIVVDANFPSGARLALSDAKKISSKPVKYVFDTHHHADHAYGNPVWTKIGAITLAYQGVVEEMERCEPARWLETAAARKDVRDLNLATAERPRQTFKKSPYVIDDGNRRVEFHFFGWGHTRGDGFVYLPQEKILCTGDAIVNGPFNYMLDANVKNWPNVVQAAQKLGVEHVLPGHGRPAGGNIISEQIRFLEEIYKAVELEVRTGKKLEDLVEMKDGRPVSTVLQLPESMQYWVGHLFPGQVQMIYEEISQGKPHGEIVAGK